MQILPALENGGVEMTTIEVNRAIVARGHQSLVVSAGGPLVEQIERDGGEHIVLDVGKKRLATLLKVAELRRLLADREVDVVNVRSRMPAWITFLAWRRMPPDARPRLITTVHGLNSVNWYSRVMTYGERVITVSQWCHDYVLKNYPETDPDKLTIVYAGIDPSDFSYGYQPDSKWLAQWRRQFPQLVDRFVVVLPGRLTRVKGHFDFIEVITKLQTAGLLVHGLIVGGEDPRRRKYAQSIRDEIVARELDADVTLTGHRADVREILAVADVVVSTTADPPESFGRTVLEAVRLGRPTVGYDHGGVHEVLERIYPEGLVPAKDVDAMAEKIMQLSRHELSPPAATDEFDLQTMLNREVDLYEEIAADAAV